VRQLVSDSGKRRCGEWQWHGGSGGVGCVGAVRSVWWWFGVIWMSIERVGGWNMRGSDSGGGWVAVRQLVSDSGVWRRGEWQWHGGSGGVGCTGSARSVWWSFRGIWMSIERVGGWNVRGSDSGGGWVAVRQLVSGSGEWRRGEWQWEGGSGGVGCVGSARSVWWWFGVIWMSIERVGGWNVRGSDSGWQCGSW
jgi:hypothetical protein